MEGEAKVPREIKSVRSCEDERESTGHSPFQDKSQRASRGAGIKGPKQTEWNTSSVHAGLLCSERRAGSGGWQQDRQGLCPH